MIERAGFPAVYMSGAAVSASLGYPDYGLVTMSEMVERAGVIARSVSIPVVSDADTGYGNELNVTRTVREFEARGVAAIHIEDQVSPKRCGHLDNKELIGRDAYVSKIRAAVAARQDPDFVIIARSDARTVNGFDDAIERVNAALAAGADVAFFESPTSEEELAAIPRLVKGDCLLNIVQAGKTPLISFARARELGYRLARSGLAKPHSRRSARPGPSLPPPRVFPRARSSAASAPTTGTRCGRRRRARAQPPMAHRATH
jgi:2-methylisocitrate lyase-like PEP mutase family enzyme